MEGESCRIFGRRCLATPRQARTKENRTRSYKSILEARTYCKSGKESHRTIKSFFIPRIFMGHFQLHRNFGERQKERIAHGMLQMEAPSTEMQANKSERFRVVHWQAKCNSLRFQGSFTPSSIDVHAAEQNGQKSRVERKDENQPVNPSEHSKMDIETEYEQTETALPNIPTTSNLDDRCIRESRGSCSTNEQQKLRFPSIASREDERPELEF
ncbi:uncharacterized protein MONOS_12575 [Monocercomonoides exilis]|uniref:uncharacterized protein n=1 Tax=Monocercomonoides exilis TaxID=2049356 RepID=UPI00355A47C8|nr:hypothetical protein MONOS_12575 [Monocercomonoides exilis]|eukprot:MONOS_12575.1-p1 / transcript=MONOS_12575.1 / gene=MONOS_12575 / organism=Monocercomonoides_exilis_PA203 / gene_product=unspecified product / transcript_product=unspecified product / location=Mono_scaffold00704:23248-23886(-) / protein_length=213 / sequence_SO=supercontig / SO=protein_coding / is_pseudo=false